MNELASFCKDLKKDFKPKIKDPKKPVKFWSEKDRLNGKIVDAFVIIFRTKGCSWALKSGCSMCGYFNDSMWQDVSDEDLLAQLNISMNNYSDQKFIKIFTSGSFFDSSEINSNVRKKILNILFEKADKISVESRPEYVNNETLNDVKSIVGSKKLEIGIGLETSNDYIRKKCLNKGFNYSDYKKAASVMKKHKVDLKTYVLIKPPFLTEKESIKDSIDTAENIKNITDSISFNPTNVQRNTFVNFLWNRRKFRPPWLFSIVEILNESKKILKDKTIKCDTVGGGSIRGAHNCKVCDRKYLTAIEGFSLTQNLNVLKNLDCECKEEWLDILDIEDLGFGSLSNIYG
jgi:radical SAM enzyme (TIGR01210 family)